MTEDVDLVRCPRSDVSDMKRIRAGAYVTDGFNLDLTRAKVRVDEDISSSYLTTLDLTLGGTSTVFYCAVLRYSRIRAIYWQLHK